MAIARGRSTLLPTRCFVEVRLADRPVAFHQQGGKEAIVRGGQFRLRHPSTGEGCHDARMCSATSTN